MAHDQYEGPERRISYKSHEEKIEKLCHIVFGNGDPGIAEQVREQRKMIESIQQDLKENKQARKQLVVGVTVGAVVAVMNLVVALVRHI